MNSTSEDLFRALRPAVLDDLAAEAYERRRDRDLEVVLALSDDTTPEPVERRGHAARSRRLVPRLLVAGLAAGAVATAVAVAAPVVLKPGGDQGGRAGGRPTTAGPATDQRVEARTFLLASAESAAKTPATSGESWHVRFSVTETVTPVGRKGPGFTVRRTQRNSFDKRTWNGVGGAPSMTVFVNPADETRWKAMGSPRLPHGYWGVMDIATPLREVDFRVRSRRSAEVLAALPTDPDGLRKALEAWWAADRRGARPSDRVKVPADFGLYLFARAQQMLAGPTSPGTKAAFYRLLADQRTIRYVGKSNDVLGRKGVMLAARGPAREPLGAPLPVATTELRLIIQQGTGLLLELQSGDRGSPSQIITFQQSEWSDEPVLRSAP